MVAIVCFLFLVERLEVVLHLPVVVTRHLLARHVFLHLLAVLAEHAHVLEAGGHVAAAPHEIGVHPVLATGPRLALDAHVERVRAQALRGIALWAGALALTGERAFAFRPISLVAGRAPLPALALAPAPPLVLSTAAEPLAVAAFLLHGAQLVERALHGLHGAIALPLLQGFHAFAEIAGVARVTLASQPLHLLQELAQLVGRELLALEASAQGLGLLENHALLALGEVALEVGQPVELLEHANALVALLEEGVEVGGLPCDGGVLEDRGEVARLGGATHAAARTCRALLHLGAADVLTLGGLRLVLALEIARPVLRLLLLFLPRAGETGQRSLRQRNSRSQSEGE